MDGKDVEIGSFGCPFRSSVGRWHPETATLADVPQLCGLLDELFAQEADFTPDRAKQTAGLALIVTDPEAGRIFLLRHEGRVVGMINVLTTISPRNGGGAVWFEDLIVHRAFRDRGAASSLLCHALAFAASAGATRVTLLTDRSNARAIRLYQRHGFAHSCLSPMRWQESAPQIRG